MTGLAGATLEVVTVDKAGQAVKQGEPVRVQFNPSALRYQLANAVEPNKASGKLPATQFVGTASATLAFDLVFDSTYPEDGPVRPSDGLAPHDVRRYIKPLQAMLTTAKPAAGPTGVGGAPKKSTVPTIRFTWGAFSLIGVVTALNLDYDLFSEDGIPLRAKAAVTMKEIDPSLISNLRGPGANTGAGAQDPAGLSGGPAGPAPGGGPAAARPTGTAPRPGPDDRVATARAGESAAELLSRLGRDPSAWKDLRLPGTDPLSLTAGARIELPAALAATAALGTGVIGGAVVDASAGSSSAVAADPRRLTAAGGLAAALSAEAHAGTMANVAAARAAFGMSSAAAPLAAAGQSGDLDRRALSFGRGVPLRAQIRIEPPGRTRRRP